MKNKIVTSVLMLFCILPFCTSCSKSKVVYTAGDYTASAKGYAGPVAVEVTFDEYSILSVKIISHNETLDIGDRAVNELPAKIVNAQSWEVDAITAATITSKAICDAVKDCTEQAKIKK
ncbi:FMN-binding protein [Treponema pedis]|uniref:FMN-binding protein n=1 Tax=Treponema pedis TaxID=409322 RepID=A0A7S7AW83_9SPIR|nr:FMN-binding protein [Treponema pedis]QOW60424.1 FMN-binding protein [Treponema pedis]